MRALILAAGLGSRLGKRTHDRPKALVEIGGRPILDYQLTALLECGIHDVGIVVGYSGESIKRFCNTWVENRSLRISFFENVDYEKTNSAYSFWLAQHWVLQGTYVHLNCDVLFPSSLLKRLISSKYQSVITLDRRVDLTDNMEQVELSNDRIIRMDNRRFTQAIGKATGLGKFGTPNVSWLVERAREYQVKGDREQNLYGLIREAVTEQDFHVLDVEPDWIMEVNTESELEMAEKMLRQPGISSSTKRP